MKKTTLLSVLTAGMIVATSVATYAVWDTVTVTSRANTVTMRNPVTISDTTGEQNIDTSAKDSLNPGTVTAAGTVTFDVENEDGVAKQLTLDETVKASGELVETTDYSIEFTGADVSGKVDSSVTDGPETYNYTITFTETGLEKLASNSNKCTVEVTATLS